MTPRQAKLLAAIIDEFINTASAVGSVNLANKYSLGVSPATIRNEMYNLVEMGYLEKPHTSSGRIPTNMAFRFFIQSRLHDLDDVQVKQSSNIYEEIFQYRFDLDKLVNTALTYLAYYSNCSAVTIIGDRLYLTGVSNLANKPEYEDRQELIKILSVVEDSKTLKKLFSVYRGNEQIRVLIGEETGVAGFDKSAAIFGLLKLHNNLNGHMGIIGPNRMNYQRNMPLVDFVISSVNKVVTGW